MRFLVRKLFGGLQAIYGRMHAIYVEEKYSKLATLATGVRLAKNAEIFNTPGNTDLIAVGSNSFINGTLYVFSHGGRISIGRDCFIGKSSQIWSADSIHIGDRVLISHDVNIHDTNAHPIDPLKRHEHFKRNVVAAYSSENDLGILSHRIIIEDDAWIGFSSIILKGVTIGKSAIVAAGSVVTADVPRNSIVAGNPAKVVKQSTPS
jgi:acetyltransferase-like isoleucine patch superfamily enzyme